MTKMKTISRPELGDEVKCKVTGFTGLVIGVAKHLTGCDRVSVQPNVDKEGKWREGYWLDITAVEIVTKGKVKPEEVQDSEPNAKVGGPSTSSGMPSPA